MAGQNMLQKLNAAKGRPPVGAAGGKFNPLGLFSGGGLFNSLTAGALLGEYGTAPAAIGLGNYLRSPQGVLAKDRLRQGDIGGVFSAVTGFGRSAAPRLEQYNPPGFDPNQPVTLADLRKTVQETGPVGSAPTAPIAPPVPQLSPQDRAYQQERARVEAMVKSNPDMQKQEIAEARAKVRDQGMEAWAKANPELAKKVMPGQSGFSAIQGVVGRMPAPSDNPLMARTFGYQTGGAPDQQIGADTIGPTPVALQADAALNPASPSFVGGEGAPIYDFTRDDLTPELLEKFQQELLSKVK